MTSQSNSGAQWTPEIPVPTRPSAVRISTTGTIHDRSHAVASEMSCLSGTASAYVSTDVMTAPSSPGWRSTSSGDRTLRASSPRSDDSDVVTVSRMGAQSNRSEADDPIRITDADDPLYGLHCRPLVGTERMRSGRSPFAQNQIDEHLRCATQRPARMPPDGHVAVKMRAINLTHLESIGTDHRCGEKVDEPDPVTRPNHRRKGRGLMGNEAHLRGNPSGVDSGKHLVAQQWIGEWIADGDDGKPDYLLETDRALGEDRMRRRCQHDERLSPKATSNQRRVGGIGPKRPQPDGGSPITKGRLDRLGITIEDSDLQERIRAAEIRQHRGKKRGARAREACDRQLPHTRRGTRLHVRDRVVDSREDRARPRQETLSLVGELQRPRTSVDECTAERPLQAGDMSRDARLGKVELRRRPRKAPRVDHLDP